MAADDLAMQGATASAAMVLTWAVIQYKDAILTA